MRKLTPYEFNQCQKYGIDPHKIVDQHIPIEYLTGHIEFCQHDFIIDQNVLIPRLESEKLVELAAALHPHTVADIGTGSGCLGLSLYLSLPQIQLYLSDISLSALRVARQNYQLLTPHSPHISILQSNLLTHYPSIKFDLIIANLPYIPSLHIATLPPNVIDFEPHLALDGGYDGLQLISALLHQAPHYLNHHGHILLEIDDHHSLLQFSAFFSTYSFQTHQDIFGKARFLELELKS